MAEDNEQMISAAQMDVPSDLEYSTDHVWVRVVDDHIAQLGITQYAANKLGELVYVDLPSEGTHVEAGDELGEFESSKAVEPIIAPVAGTVRFSNHEVVDDPSLIADDPYGEGWLINIELDDDEPELMQSEEYLAMIQ